MKAYYTLSPEQIHHSWGPVRQAPRLHKPSQQPPKLLYHLPHLETTSRQSRKKLGLIQPANNQHIGTDHIRLHDIFRPMSADFFFYMHSPVCSLILTRK